MNKIEQEIADQSVALRNTGIIPARVKLGSQEWAILDAPEDVDIAGTQPLYVTNPQTGRQSFMGLEIVRVDLSNCIHIEG